MLPSLNKSNNFTPRVILVVLLFILLFILLGELLYIAIYVKKNAYVFIVPTKTKTSLPILTISPSADILNITSSQENTKPWPFDQKTTIQVSHLQNEELLLYSFLGTFDSLNIDKELIFLKGLDQKIYMFKITNLIDYDIKKTKVINVLENRIENMSKIMFRSYYQESNDGPTLFKTDFIKIEWLDSFTQNRTLESFGKNLGPLNSHFGKVSSFVVLKK